MKLLGEVTTVVGKRKHRGRVKSGDMVESPQLENLLLVTKNLSSDKRIWKN